MMIVAYILCYLLGAFPTGVLITRFHKIDISKIGSGNVGATNVTRALGPKWGLLTLFIDVLKGYIAVKVGEEFGLIPELSGALAVLGHIFSIPFLLKGGKGVATLIGVMLGVNLVALLSFCISVVIIFTVSRIVSLACLISILVTLGVMHFIEVAHIYVWILMACAIIFAHRGNILRLVKGQEPKFSFGNK